MTVAIRMKVTFQTITLMAIEESFAGLMALSTKDHGKMGLSTE